MHSPLTTARYGMQEEHFQEDVCNSCFGKDATHPMRIDFGQNTFNAF